MTMTRSHSIKHLPAGVLLANRVHRDVLFSWIKVLLLLAAATLAISLLGLINVAASADHRDLSLAANGKVVTVALHRDKGMSAVAVGCLIRVRLSEKFRWPNKNKSLKGRPS